MSHRPVRTAAALSALALTALALAACDAPAATGTAREAHREPVGTAAPAPGAAPTPAVPTLAPFDHEAVLAEGVELSAGGARDLAPFDDVAAEYVRATETWPLPVPEAYPFPDAVAEIAGGTLYTVGYGLRQADAWWTCAAETTAIAAHRGGDDQTASYWLDALRLWWQSDAKAHLTENTHAYVADALDPADEGDWNTLTRVSDCDGILDAGGR